MRLFRICYAFKFDFFFTEICRTLCLEECFCISFILRMKFHYFILKKTSAKSQRILVEVYDEHSLAERACQKWLARFKSGLEDEERLGRSKWLENEALEALLDAKKIVAKHKKSSQNLWESLKQPFHNI